MADESKDVTPDGDKTVTPDGGKNSETVSRAEFETLLKRLEASDKERKDLISERDEAKRKKRDKDEEAARKAEEAALASKDVEALKRASDELRAATAAQLREKDEALAAIDRKYRKQFHTKELQRRIAPFVTDLDVATMLIEPMTEMFEENDAADIRPKSFAGTVEAFAEKWLAENKPYLLKSQRAAGNGVDKSGTPAQNSGAKYTYEQLRAMSDAEYAALVRKDPSIAKIYASGG